MNLLSRIGRPVSDAILLGYHYCALTGRWILAVLDIRQPGSRVVRRTTFMQIYFTGVQALPIVMLLSGLLGIVLAAVIPQRELLVTFLVRGYVRELSSLVAALIILARSTTAISVELGNMTVGGEVELLKNLGINPDSFVIRPRVFGVVFASVGLAIVASATAPLAAALFLGVTTQTSPMLLIMSVTENIGMEDVRALIIKSVLFGGILVLSALHEGLHLKPFTTEVPKAVSKAVIRALTWLWITEVILLLASYAWQ